MTPGARIAAAIEILDAISQGMATEQALTRWARSSRYAGSKDRAAVRDHVFDAVRHWRSDAVRGGGETGRARMIGRLRAMGTGPDTLFDGVGYAPSPLTEDEHASGATPTETGTRWDLPDWMVPLFKDSLGDNAESAALTLTDRAPVTLRINTAKCAVQDAQSRLASEGIEAGPNPRASTALTVRAGARRVRNSATFTDGWVELQDASSQAAVATLSGSGRALDFCAGGGGKSLALAAAGWQVTAHDIDTHRMRDIPERAARGGHDITVCAADDVGAAGPFDLVLCDAPCSGSGTWRRAPDAKWALTAERLDALVQMQRDVLDTAVGNVGAEGALVYATCSVLLHENERQVAAFLERHPEWAMTHRQSWPIDQWGDGFFVAQFRRDQA